MQMQTLQPVNAFNDKTELSGATEKSSREVKLTLKELSHAASISERTVRYYIQQGLLPAPQGAGPGSRYNLEHLTRLALIRRLKAALLPLSEIRQLLSEVPTSDLEQVAHEFYDELTRTNPVAPEPTRPAIRINGLKLAQTRQKAPSNLEVFIPPEVMIEEVAQNAAGAESQTPLKRDRLGGKWNRITLSAGLELHFEEGGTQDSEAGHDKLARLLEFARQLYAEE